MLRREKVVRAPGSSRYKVVGHSISQKRSIFNSSGFFDHLESPISVNRRSRHRRLLWCQKYLRAVRLWLEEPVPPLGSVFRPSLTSPPIRMWLTLFDGSLVNELPRSDHRLSGFGLFLPSYDRARLGFLLITFLASDILYYIVNPLKCKESN